MVAWSAEVVLGRQILQRTRGKCSMPVNWPRFLVSLKEQFPVYRPSLVTGLPLKHLTFRRTSGGQGICYDILNSCIHASALL